MKTLYFFTTSLNFGNIFSSESISPENFYAKRGYGFDYYENPFHNIKDYIVFFEHYPLIELSTSNEIDIYKIVLEFDASDLQIEKSDLGGVWFCPSTVYITLRNLKRVYFSSNDEKARVVAKAESSKALKTLLKYEPCFATNSPSQKTSYDVSKSVFFKKFDLEVFIEQDRVFNGFKGFIYGLICSKLNQKNPNEIAYSKSLQEIKNGFALLKNSLAHNSFSNYSKEKSFNKPAYNTHDYNSTSEVLKNLKKSIDDSERLFISFIDTIGKIDFVLEYLKKVVFKSFTKEVSADHIEGALQLAKSMRGFEKNLEREARNWFWENNQNNPYILYEVMRYSIQVYRETLNKEKQGDLDSDILKALFRLEKNAEGVLLQKSKSEPIIDFNLIEFQNLEVKLPETLNEDDKFEQLVNIVLQNSKRGKGKINDQQLIPLVEKAGELYQTGVGKKTNLYRYLTKQVIVYTEPTNTTTVMKNFTAFVFNPNDIEKLQKYVEEKAIPEPQYAFAFFGAFNGFASLSKDFTKPIIGNQDFQFGLDEYFKKIQNNINQIKVFFRSETISMNSEMGLSYQEIMNNSISPIISTQTAEEADINQDITKIDLKELSEVLLSKGKREKIIKPTLQEKFGANLNNSLKEIDKILNGLPYKGQLEFTKSRLFVLLTTKYKIKGLGEQSLRKLLADE
jgi:hypothetical protein